MKGKIIGGSVAAVLLAAAALIAPWEGLRTDPYRDIVGVWTVCYGETNVEMRRYTVAECEAMLARSVGRPSAPGPTTLVRQINARAVWSRTS